MAQLEKNPPAMRETWAPSLGWEDPQDKGKTTHSRILTWRIPWTVARQAPLSMGFSRHEYWSGLLFVFSRDLPDPGMEPTSPAAAALAGGFFFLPLSHLGSLEVTLVTEAV